MVPLGWVDSGVGSSERTSVAGGPDHPGDRPTGGSTGIRATHVARTGPDSRDWALAETRPTPRTRSTMSTTGDVTEAAIRLARSWLSATAEGQTATERRTTGRLAALVADPAGLELAVRFVDRVARPQDVRVAARELAGLTSGAASGFLGPLDRAMLGVGALVAPVLPDVVVPAARQRLRSLVGHLVADDGPGLATHLAATRAEGFRLNLNLLGEAVLGEREATARLARVTALVERPDVDYVSVKVSAVASQLSTWDTEGSVGRVVERLRPLYLTAARHGTFLNLDMEEYRDLTLTLRVFERLVSDPELLDAEAGIVLQAYLPDARGRARRAHGHRAGAPRGGRRAAQGPAGQGRQPRDGAGRVRAARLAAGALRLEGRGRRRVPAPGRPRARPGADAGAARGRRQPQPLPRRRRPPPRAARAASPSALDIEMLQGMAPAQARAVRDEVGAVLLYTPVVARDDFDVAISYLVRRLEENSASQNFLHALFAPGEADGRAGGGVPASRSRDRARAVDRAAPGGPARSRDAPARPRLREHARHRPRRARVARAWARGDRRRATSPVPDGAVAVSTTAEVDAVVARAVAAAPAWAAHRRAERAAALHARRRRARGRAGRPRRDDGPRGRQDRRGGRPRGQRGRRLRALLRRPRRRPRGRRRARRRAPARAASPW